MLTLWNPITAHVRRIKFFLYRNSKTEIMLIMRKELTLGIQVTYIMIVFFSMCSN